MEPATSVRTDLGSDVANPDVAYLILSHKNSEQVEALAARILELSPHGHVVVHHDLKTDDVPWLGRPPRRVHLVDRTRVEWGDWSIVAATLRMIRYATERIGANWIVVLSGEHWPVINLEAWERRLMRENADALLPAVRLPQHLHFGLTDLDGNRFLARCAHRWMAVKRPRSKAAHRGLAGIAKVSLFLHPILKLEFSLRSDAWFVGLPRRLGPVKGWHLFKGSEWFACNARAASVLLCTDPSVMSWFRRSHIPDESYFQSVLHHDRDLAISDSLVTWVPPEPETPRAGWMLMTLDQLPHLWTSGVAFARKVDPQRNPDVIKAIDGEVDRRRTSAGDLGAGHIETLGTATS